MPTQQRRLQQARRNEDLYHHLATVAPTYIDWQITALFYSALHYVDAYLAKHNVHPSSHAERDRLITMESVLRRIYTAYRDLESYSRDARYELHSIAPGYEQTLYSNQFTAIRDYLLAVI